ncbi:Phospholipase D zeta 1 [Dionaea muscipula]
MAKRGRLKHVVPVITKSDSSRKVTSDVDAGKVSSEGVGEVLDSMRENLGLDVEIDSVLEGIADSGKGIPQDTVRSAIKMRGARWARKDGGAKQVNMVNKTFGGLSDGTNQVGGNERKDERQEVRRRSRDRLRVGGPDLSSKPLEHNNLVEISLVNSDSLRLQCGIQPVWAVLKPGFLALLGDPFDSKLLDIIVFDVLPASDGNGEGRVQLAEEVKERNPLRHSLKVTCGNRSIRLRTRTNYKCKDWVAAINDAGLRPPEGWCHPHRFGSFAPPRGLTDDGSQAQWFVDGQAAFEAIALAIENSKSEIFICGWWVCPELYLRRPFQEHASSRLDALLEAKAKEGIQWFQAVRPDKLFLCLIYILLYKEVALALKINSVYSKRKLLNIHENVRVLRFPDHFSTGVYLWSHHEKIVIVDHQICFIGGLDLCFGRYDTCDHQIGDFFPTIWPGKDYYNPRESEPNSWEETMKDELDRTKYPRMPWHDVHCAIWGPPCRDVARHFVQRWNHAKRNKAPNEQAIPLLIPQHHMVIPHYMGRNGGAEVEDKSSAENHNMKRQDSFSSRMSFQDLPLLLPQEAVGDGEPTLSAFDVTLDHTDQQMKVMKGAFSFRKSKVEPLVSDMPMIGFVDDFDMLDRSVYPATRSFDKEWWDTQERDSQVVASDETGQVGPCVSCRCQVGSCKEMSASS